MLPSDGSTLRCRPSPVLEYTQSALTVTSLRRRRPVSAMRLSSNTCAGSSASSFRVISVTLSAIRSRNVSLPGSAPKQIVVVEPNVRASRVRSSWTW